MSQENVEIVERGWAAWVRGDRVLVTCWQQGYGPGSEVPVRMDWAQICSLRGGLVYRMEAYSDRREALEAVGLSG